MISCLSIRRHFANWALALRSTCRPQPILVSALLMIHAGHLAYLGTFYSPTLNEPAFLAAGVRHWQLGSFEMYRANPPLVRIVAAAPVLMAGARTDWHQFYSGAGARPELEVGSDFVAANGPRTIWLLMLARWACLPFSLLGAYVCFLWARTIYGVRAGLFAMSLWCFCPSIIGHGSLITTDVPAAALTVAAAYSFWLWLDRPTWFGALEAGLVLGLAELTKFTLLVFYLVWPLLWILCRWSRWPPDHRDTVREIAMLTSILLGSIWVINVGYGFEGTGTRLGEFKFVSKLLTDPEAGRYRNRFSESLIAVLPIPFPSNYVTGIDTQRHDFERFEHLSYLGGVFQKSGWWYYYLYAFAVKLPVGTLGILCMSVIARFNGQLRNKRLCAEAVLVWPSLMVLGLVSSQTGFNEHMRYALPVLPCVFIWMSQVAESPLRRWRLASALALGCSVASCMAAYPHMLPYFNELAGGPLRGSEHLLGSNVEWGQDYLLLKKWSEEHPEARPMFVGGEHFYDPADIGIDATDLAKLPSTTQYGPATGWYALGINEIIRRRLLDINPNDTVQKVMSDGRPVCRIGCSLYIYCIEPRDTRSDP